MYFPKAFRRAFTENTARLAATKSCLRGTTESTQRKAETRDHISSNALGSMMPFCLICVFSVVLTLLRPPVVISFPATTYACRQGASNVPRNASLAAFHAPCVCRLRICRMNETLTFEHAATTMGCHKLASLPTNPFSQNTEQER